MSSTHRGHPFLSSPGRLCTICPEPGKASANSVGESLAVVLSEEVNFPLSGVRAVTKEVLKARRVAITSGPTRAPIDAVRFMSNRSTGALGVAIADHCLREGAKVTFFHGAGSLLPRPRAGLEIVEIETVEDLIAALEKRLRKERYDIFFHAMAVLDYVPSKPRKTKVRSGKDGLTLRLVKTPKVISLVKRLSPQTILVGFKLEVGATKARLVEAAGRMMRSSKADFVLANDLRTVEKGRHVGYLVEAEGRVQGPFKGKGNIARALVKTVKDRLS